MGIFDKIKFKKDEKGGLVEKTEKSEISEHELKTTEVDKAAKMMPHMGGEKSSMKKESVAAVSHVVIRPVITEKSAHLAAENKYVFEISTDATRIDVKRAMKAMYGIAPTKVNMRNVTGKHVRFGRRQGKRKDWKKAIVTLPAGKTIDVYEGV